MKENTLTVGASNPLGTEGRCSADFRTPNKTKKDVADFVGVTVRTVENMLARSGLPYYRLGSRRVRFRLSDVMDWMERNNRVF